MIANKDNAPSRVDERIVEGQYRAKAHGIMVRCLLGSHVVDGLRACHVRQRRGVKKPRGLAGPGYGRQEQGKSRPSQFRRATNPWFLQLRPFFAKSHSRTARPIRNRTQLHLSSHRREKFSRLACFASCRSALSNEANPFSATSPLVYDPSGIILIFREDNWSAYE